MDVWMGGCWGAPSPAHAMCLALMRGAPSAARRAHRLGPAVLGPGCAGRAATAAAQVQAGLCVHQGPAAPSPFWTDGLWPGPW